MTEREALEHQIGLHVDVRNCGSPLDAALLGAYADWLDERGLDPDLARGLRSGHCPSLGSTYNWYDGVVFSFGGHLDDLPTDLFARLDAADDDNRGDSDRPNRIGYEKWARAFAALGRSMEAAARRAVVGH